MKNNKKRDLLLSLILAAVCVAQIGAGGAVQYPHTVRYFSL